MSTSNTQVQMYKKVDMEGETLRVLGKNPFEDITTKTRFRQLLQTHQGRDKLFKVIQYLLRIRLWWNSINFNVNYTPGEDFSRQERNLMTIVNSRRLFRLGRFFGEFVRLRVTLIKASEIMYNPQKGSRWLALFIQLQMMLDIVARSLLFTKTIFEDIAFLVQKDFFRSDVAGKLIQVATKCGLPVLSIDFVLNTLRLYQGLVDASSSEAEDVVFSSKSFSLLSKYDRIDKLRRTMALSTEVSNRQSNVGVQNVVQDASNHDDGIVYVKSYLDLLWTDFELHWVCVTELKLMLDIFVAFVNTHQLASLQGYVNIAGLLSGLCSVYRVWTYGR